jgi:hypothetical protein
LQAYAIRCNPYDFEQDGAEAALKRLLDGLRTGELFFYGSDLHGRYDVDDEWSLKEHAERYLGIEIDWGNFSFSCSC